WFTNVLGGIGVMSYSLYLIHVPLLRLLVSWLPAGTSLDFWLLRLVVIVPACLGVAGLFFLLVERRFLAGSSGGRSSGSGPAARAGLSGLWVFSLRRRPGRYPARPSPLPAPSPQPDKLCRE